MAADSASFTDITHALLVDRRKNNIALFKGRVEVEKESISPSI